MYSFCKTNLPPSTVEHSIYCHFYNKHELNLVVAGANRLTIYKIVRYIDSEGDDSSTPDFNATKSIKQHIKLECKQSFELYGTVESLQKVRLGNEYTFKRDSLVISFDDAKLSIVEYDPNSHDLKTLSMHYFEDDFLRDGYVTNHHNAPIVRIEPQDRCAAMLIYGKHIVVIPLIRENVELLDPSERFNSSTLSMDESIAGPAVTSLNHIAQPQIRQAVTLTPAVTPSFRSPVLPSYKIDLSEETCGEKINNIVDIQFLHNYSDPTLVILYEPVRTWSGRIATRQDTFSMVVLSMNIHQHLQPIIWAVNNLPYDCQKILPVPKPIGGLLVVAVNELIYLNQSIPPYGVPFNSFTKDSSEFPLNSRDANKQETNEYINISLDLSEAVFLTSNKILFILKNGEVYLVTLFNDDMRCIRNFQFDRIGTTVQPNTLTLCDNNLVFVGSHVGDSVLLEYIEKEIFDDKQNGSQIVKQPSIKSFIYEHDKLLSCSSSSRVCYGEATNISENFTHDSKEPFVELVTASGYDKNGSVCVFQQTIKPQIQDTFDLKDCVNIWTLKPSDSVMNDLMREYEEKLSNYHVKMREYHELIQQSIKKDLSENNLSSKIKKENDITRDTDSQKSYTSDEAYNEHNKSNNNRRSESEDSNSGDEEKETLPDPPQRPEEPSTDSHSFMIISRESTTRIYATGDDFKEISREDCEFEVTTSTIFAGNIGSKNLTIQVTAAGVFLLDGLKMIDKLELSGCICDASICDGYIIALAQNGSIYFIMLDECSQSSATNHKLSLVKEFVALEQTKIIAFSIYKDVSGTINVSTREDQEAAFRQDIRDYERAMEINQVASPADINISNSELRDNDDDEDDDDIYGPSAEYLSEKGIKNDRDSPNANPKPNKRFCPDPSDATTNQPSRIDTLSELISGNLDDDDIYGATVGSPINFESEEPEIEPKVETKVEPVSEVPIETVKVKLEPVEINDNNETISSFDQIYSAKTDLKDDESEKNSLHSVEDDTKQQESEHISVKQEAIVEEPVQEETYNVDLSAEINDTSRYSNIFEIKKSNPTYWLFLVDDRGVLEIYSVPDFKLVYLSKNLPIAPKILLDNVQYYRNDADLDPSLPKIKEILVTALGTNGQKPTIFLRLENELVVYEAYSFQETLIENHLNVRFRKIETVLLNNITNAADRLKIEGSVMPDEPVAAIKSSSHRQEKSKSNRASKHHHRNRHLSNINNNFNINEKKHWLNVVGQFDGYNAVFLLGPKPRWFLMSQSGILRSHAMTVDKSIYCFSNYTSQATHRPGFIYYNETKELRIACLSNGLNLDYPWPVRKFNVGGTAHFVNYHVERKVYCVVISKLTPCSKIMKVGSEPDTMKIEVLDRDAGYIPPIIEKFELQLYDSENWETVPDCKIEFDEWEQVTCVKNVLLTSEGTTSGLKGYIAISTNYCYGEDVPNRGRIWILDLIEVVPEPGKPLTKNKIKKVYCAEQKGPVTTLTHTCGLLLSAVGQKIYLWQLKDESLDGIAFIDTQIYIHSAVCVKNLVLVSDICKSISLLRYQQGTRTLSMVCRDTKPLEVFACDFVIDNEILNFVVTDSEKNIIIYSYDPEHRDSNGGTRLLRKADYHLGAFVNSMCRIKCKLPAQIENEPSEAALFKNRQLTIFLTIDGSFGYLAPVSEIVYRRLLMLQNEMTVAIPHIAGLNPKAWRLVKHYRKSLANPSKSILDGDFIQRFLHLSQTERQQITRKIGTTVDKILADLQHIYESTMIF